jgi:hypothetical protein
MCYNNGYQAIKCSSAIVVNSQFSVSAISGSCDKMNSIDSLIAVMHLSVAKGKNLENKLTNKQLQTVKLKYKHCSKNHT